MKEKEISSEIIERKVKYFFDNQSVVHLVLKNARWLNGVVEEISSDFFMFKDKKRGKLPVFYLEVFKIDPYESLE